jgi:hypothetical protein
MAMVVWADRSRGACRVLTLPNSRTTTTWAIAANDQSAAKNDHLHEGRQTVQEERPGRSPTNHRLAYT